MRWVYAAAWLMLLAIYSAAFIVNGVAVDLALRNAIANLLPEIVLGLAMLHLPAYLPWSEQRRARFFAAHAGLLIAFVILASAGWIALVVLDSFLFSATAQINYRILPFRILNDVLIYGTLAGVAYVRDQAARAANAEALRARASLEAMRSQLNPHFILNTFHALVGLVRRDPAAAESALERLGDLLRYSLRIQRDGIDEVTLREECAFVESYLALERLRLGERLSVRIEALPSDETLVPAFAVQTLVENAIHHAIAPRAAVHPPAASRSAAVLRPRAVRCGRRMDGCACRCTIAVIPSVSRGTWAAARHRARACLRPVRQVPRLSLGMTCADPDSDCDCCRSV